MRENIVQLPSKNVKYSPLLPIDNVKNPPLVPADNDENLSTTVLGKGLSNSRTPVRMKRLLRSSSAANESLNSNKVHLIIKSKQC